MIFILDILHILCQIKIKTILLGYISNFFSNLEYSNQLQNVK